MALSTFGRLVDGSTVITMSTMRERDIGATWGEVAPIAKAAMKTTRSGSGLKTTHAMKASAAQLRTPAMSST